MQENAENAEDAEGAEDAEQDAKNAEAVTINRLIQARLAGWANDPSGTGSVLVERATGCVFWSFDGNPIRRQQREKFPPADRIDKGKFRNHVGFFEGLIQYMYLDVEGNVTVGIGHLLDDATEADGLPFYDRETRLESHSIHIENAFNKVLRNIEKAKDGASAFKNLTHLDLDLDAIEALFDKDVAGFKKLFGSGAGQRFEEFWTYPASAQLGMLDIAYTMGVHRFFDGFPVFRDALKSRNWLKVADESGREVLLDKQGNPGLMAERNKIVRGWFLDAFKDEPFFLNSDCPPKQLPV